MPKFAMFFCFLLILFQAGSSLSAPLTVKEIVAMSRSGVADEVIIEKIRNSGTHLDLTVNEIIDLKRKGVSLDVIRELIRTVDTANAASPTDLQAEIEATPVTPAETPSPIPHQPTPTLQPTTRPTARPTALPTAQPTVPQAATPDITLGDPAGNGEKPLAPIDIETERVASATPTDPPSSSASPLAESHQETPESKSYFDDIIISTDETEAQGIIKIHSTPAKAQVIFDGKPVGYTPYYTNIRFEGRHSLVLKKKWYRDLRVEIDLEKTMVSDIHLPLELEHPVIIIRWTVEDAALSSLYWSMQNCPESVVEGMVPLELLEHEGANTVVYTIDEAHGNQSVTGAHGCLEGMIWLSSKVPLSITSGDPMPEPNVVFYLTNVELSSAEPVELGVSVHLDRRYPQGLRLVLTGSTGQLIRLTN